MRRLGLLTMLALSGVAGLVLAAVADGAALKVATLTSSPFPAHRYPNFQWLDSSGGTVVAAGNVADVFTESPSGWTSGPPSAVLSDLSASGSFADGLSMSGQTVVEGLSGMTAPLSEDVFVRPSGGWSGAVLPAARLVGPGGQSLTGGVISGQTVAAYGVALPGGVEGPRVAQSVNVFTEPSTGWSGVIAAIAELAVPGGIKNGLASGLAISGAAIFVGSGRYVYVFTEPSSGWSGTVSPTARLRVGFSEPISVSGRNLLVEGSVFSEPSSGWSGTIQPVGHLYPAGPGGFLGGQAMSGDTAVMSEVQPEHYGCPCPGRVNVFTEPLAGWSGTEVSFPAISPSSGTSILPVTLQNPDLFLTDGDTVDVYHLTGRYGVRAGPPSVTNGGVSGLRAGRPRLRFTIATKSGYPTVETLTMSLPHGLAFTRSRTSLTRGISITSVRKPILSEHHGVLTVRPFPYPSTVKVTVRPPALMETSSLKTRSRRLAERNQHIVLHIKIQTRTNVGAKTAITLKLRG